LEKGTYQKGNLMNKLFRFFMLAALIPPFLLACSEDRIQRQSFKLSTTQAMIEPGDTIDNMVVTTGADDAPPLWAFCSKSLEGKGSYILDCRVPALASLGIGNIFLYADQAITNLDWSDLGWELSIDGQEVDLESFGTFDYVVPTMSKSPSSVREIFKRGTTWNIVLTNLQPGHHTLWFVAQSKIGSYTWFVDLEIEPVDETNISSIPFPLHS
jgi:hypothetical protein